MADILRITTPLVDKNHIQPNKQVTDPSVPFNLSDVTKVIQPGQESEILKQNNGLLLEEQPPSILMDMLKDPSVAVGFLKNIYLLQEIIQLLPINNMAMTQELQQMYDQMLLAPDEVLGELLRQENASTTFKGELFDTLRTLLHHHEGSPDARYAVTNLLKSLNALFYRQDVLRSVSNSLLFLSESLQPSKELSQQFAQLSEAFRAPDAGERFPQLRDAVLTLLKDMESSILYTPKLQKIAPMVIYNLSRYNDNPDFIREALHNLLTLVNGSDAQEKLAQLVQQRIEDHVLLRGQNRSQVMDVLAKLIHKQAQDSDLKLLGAEKIEKLVHSLLSSPCNFTPLLHYILPVQDGDIRSFAEIWVDQEQEKTEEHKEPERFVHMLIVFDVEGVGQFEAELYLRGQEISAQLFCPPAYQKAFAGVGDAVSGALAGTGYHFGTITVEKMERQRSLMEVFKTLPHKRTGVNVKV